MSNLQIIVRLCALLDMAQEIIREQAALLAMHGIETDGTEMEGQRSRLLDEIERSV